MYLSWIVSRGMSYFVSLGRGNRKVLVSIISLNNKEQKIGYPKFPNPKHYLIIISIPFGGLRNHSIIFSSPNTCRFDAFFLIYSKLKRFPASSSTLQVQSREQQNDFTKNNKDKKEGTKELSRILRYIFVLYCCYS